MYYKSKNISLIILAVTSLILSRAWFFFISDPEGPNLLVVAVLAAIVYALSWAAYTYISKERPLGLDRLVRTVIFQALLLTLLYIGLR